MNFTEAMAATPIYAVTETGRGLLPPILRTYGHILYLAGRQAESATRRPRDNDISEELDHCTQHLANINTENLTEASKDRIDSCFEAIRLARLEFESWDAETRGNNFITLANFLIASLVPLDRELVGIRDSDIGMSL